MSLKQKIIEQLETKNFPNLKFLYSDEVLNIASEILDDFLIEEKKDFEKRLKISDENISFDIFNEEFRRKSYFKTMPKSN